MSIYKKIKCNCLFGRKNARRNNNLNWKYDGIILLRQDNLKSRHTLAYWYKKCVKRYSGSTIDTAVSTLYQSNNKTEISAGSSLSTCT